MSGMRARGRSGGVTYSPTCNTRALAGTGRIFATTTAVNALEKRSACQTETEMTKPRHLSMLRSYTAADALTIGNAACGAIAIFLCLDYLVTTDRRFLWAAFVLLPGALL